MVEAVEKRKLYQVTCTSAYKTAFTLGQMIDVGNEPNPFFQFYETTLEYPVTDGATGRPYNLNAVEWLHQVKIGVLQTAPQILAEIAWTVSQHYMMLARELLMEQIRVEDFNSSPPSRQRCLYLSDTIEEARTWLPLLGGNGAVCELTRTGVIHRADSRQMVILSEPLQVTRDKAKAYWQGKVSADPRMETLFTGKAEVTSIGL
ncbi:DUF2441 domain-containing protein [Bradyrhizobium sp. 83002]|uniref:DUF2441 domain-containing protein n=1 Tax=Bradyrhizobium aeschynomenes TaxID=2734909 RepID=UPI0015533704|nr:DUF2441 domain-containing protein [Bradyrhizobium aeschynomenes]NPU11369.1 DUF2441 domain-containing protein [Bradyrhizobium aeschynomenes]